METTGVDRRYATIRQVEIPIITVFVFQDEPMRLFDLEIGIMDKLGLKDGEMIQHPMITKSIERAQKKLKRITSHTQEAS